jgi:hypothetical protein
MKPLVIGIDRTVLRPVLYIGSALGLVISVGMVWALVAGPSVASIATVAKAVAAGFGIGLVFPAGVAVASILRIEVDATSARQLLAGRTVSEQPTADIREARFSVSMFPAVLTFANGTQYRVIGIPLGQISAVKRRLRELVPGVTIREP